MVVALVVVIVAVVVVEIVEIAVPPTSCTIITMKIYMIGSIIYRNN